MPKVSIFPRISEIRTGAEVELSDILFWIKSGEWAEKINKIHEAIGAGMAEKEIAKIKSDIPYFTGSGTFSLRNDQGLVRHSGRLVIDFDKVTDLQEAKQKICADKYSEAVFVSCTGRGFAVIVKINPEKHLESFKFLEKYYKDTYSLVIDKACKDVSRPRYISHDPDLFSNPAAELVRLPSATIDGDPEKYDWIMNLHNRYESFIEGNRHNYLVILSMRLNKYGVDSEYSLNRLLAEFICADKTEKEITNIHKWAYQKNDQFGTKIINKSFKELPPEEALKIKKIASYAHAANQAGRVLGDADVMMMCNEHLISLDQVKGIFSDVFKKHADEFDLDNKAEIYRLKLFLSKKYDIKKNIVLDRIEFKRKSEEKFRFIDLHTINVDLMDAGFKFAPEKTRTIILSDFVKKYDPFVEYFESLPEWKEGEEDHIQKLAAYIKTDDQEFWETQFKKALIRSVRCALDHQENRIVMALVQEKQYTGKSTFIRWLCPMDEQYFSDTLPEPGKDAEIALTEKFMWSLDELDELPKHDMNRIKSMISRASVNQRRAYAEFATSAPRRVSFWASTNKTEFLTDTSNTRWLCFSVESIDFEYKKNCDINRVWAQAYALYNLGHSGLLTKEETERREKKNNEHAAGSHEMELILKRFKVCSKDEGVYMSVAEIQIELEKNSGRSLALNRRNVGIAMTRLGFVFSRKKIHGNVFRGYHVGNVTENDDRIFDPDSENDTPPF